MVFGRFEFGRMRRVGWDVEVEIQEEKRHWELTLIKRSAGAEYARRTILGREE